MDVDFAQLVFGNDPVGIEMEPERHAGLFNEADRQEGNTDVARQRVDRGRKKQQISILQA